MKEDKETKLFNLKVVNKAFQNGVKEGKQEAKKELVKKWDKGYEQGYEMGNQEAKKEELEFLLRLPKFMREYSFIIHRIKQLEGGKGEK